MRILKTIQKFGVLNKITAIDKRNKEDNKNYLYTILPKSFKAPIMTTEDSQNIHYINSTKGQLKYIIENMTTIVFENKEKGIKGVTESDLLEVVRDRLASTYNKYDTKALAHIEEALMWLNNKEKEEEFIQKNVLKKENYNLKTKLSKLEKEKEDLQAELKVNRRKHNARGAGRKKDTHLEVYLLSCWAKEMKDNEIIGSEYDGFNGKKKVAYASYYRAKKRLFQKRP